MYDALAAGEDLNLDWQFWVYFSVFIASWIGSAIFQSAKMEDHEDLDDYYTKN